MQSSSIVDVTTPTLSDKVGAMARDLRDIVYNGKSPTVFRRNDSIFVSAEDGGYFADYYGEFRGRYPWIHPILETWAKSHGGYWEWENPGCIYFVG